MRYKTVLVFFSFVLVAMAGMLVGYRFASLRVHPTIIEKVVVDTIAHVEPKPVSTEVTKYVTRWLPSIPTPVVVDDFKPATEILSEMTEDAVPQETQDSSLVRIPIETKVYFEEGQYYAEVTGFEPCLSYIEVYPKTTTQYVEVPKKQRFAFGPTVALGVGNRGVGWMIGVGFTWNILP